MCQGGDPTGTGRGGPGYRFDDELPKPREYQIGSVAMANAGPEHERQPVLPDVGLVRRRPAAAVQPVRPDREGSRRRSTRCRTCRPAAATGRRPTSSSTRSPSPSPTTDVSGATMARTAVISRSQARRIALAAQGFTDAAADRARRPPPSPSGGRPDGADPDRLGQRARAQPGAAAVRPARAASADADRRRHAPPASCSSTGSTRRATCRSTLSPELGGTMAQAAPVGGGGAHSPRPPASYIDERPGQGSRQRPGRRRRPPAARRPEGFVVGLGRRQDRARAPVPRRAR